MSEPSRGPFEVTPASVPFIIVPGLVLMFTLGPAAAPAFPLAATALFAGAIGAVLGLLVYARVRALGPLARIGALTVLCVALWAAASLLVR